MDEPFPARLSKLTTRWTLYRLAHTGPADAAAMARRLLIEQYAGAAHRYLVALLRDPAAADDLTQDFAVAFIEGKFGTATPERGRFRDYLKSALFHMVARHRQQAGRRPALAERIDVADPNPPFNPDQAFLDSWRDELVARTWQALNEARPTYFTTLHFRAVHPEMSAEDMARALSMQLGGSLTAASVRQTLHRAREMFADLLVDEIEQSLDKPSGAEVEAELQALDLLTFCAPALAKRLRRGPP
jgi:RNA polymerase sigma-70 factor (ECF subfamily)